MAAATAFDLSGGGYGGGYGGGGGYSAGYANPFSLLRLWRRMHPLTPVTRATSGGYGSYYLDPYSSSLYGCACM